MAEEAVTTEAKATETKAAESTDATTETKPEPKYTDKDLNDKIAAGSARAQKELLKKYGLESEEALAELKKLRDEKMTEAERSAAALKEKEDAILAAKAEAEDARAEAEALKKLVPPEKVARLVKIAKTYEGDTMADKIAAAIADFPEFVSSSSGKNVGVESKSTQVNDEERLLAIARKQAGLTK